MDESVINGANLFFPRQFGINPAESVYISGLTRLSVIALRGKNRRLTKLTKTGTLLRTSTNADRT